MFGGGVDQGPNNPGDVCTAAFIAEGDTCGSGTTGTGPGEFFGAWPWVGSFIAVDSSDTVYVGDEERVLKFTKGGVFIGEVEPVTAAGKGFVQSLDVDATGNLYLGYGLDLFGSRKDVDKLTPTGATICTMEVKSPRAIAVDDQTGDVYVVRREGAGFPVSGVEHFSSNCANQNLPFGEDELDAPSGVGVGSACFTAEAKAAGGSNIYVSNSEYGPSFIRAFGPPPDNSDDCPPPLRPPEIGAQFATAVDATGASVRAEINPKFWRDTSYYVEYGPGKCSEGGCEQRANFPGIPVTDEVTDEFVTSAGVFLPSLQPNVEYHYRFVAQSTGGGPVRGEEGKVGLDGKEGSFQTLPLPPNAADTCPNAAFRSGPGARLADCRSFEMVSPIDKEGSDILALDNVTGIPARLDQSAPSGGALTYSSYRAFGDAQAAPYASQYIAARTGSGWTSQSISPLREGPSLMGLDSEFKAFSEDLSQAWLVRDTEPMLSPGAPVGFPNIYRRDNLKESYEVVSTEVPQNAGPSSYGLEVQGMSADGAHSVFTANDFRPPAASSGIRQVYDSVNGTVSPVCILPGETRSQMPCSAGTSNSSVADHAASLDHAISADGSRIYWTNANTGTGRIYLRVKGSDTVPVSDTANPSKPPTNAQFWTAAADGSKAVFTVEEGSRGLYVFDLASKTAKQIAASSLGVVGASDDASRVYFVSEEVLGAASGPEAGKPNLYLYEAGEPPTYTFIATLAAADVSASSTPLSLIAKQPRFSTSRVTPDGRHLAFMSQASLTGADNLDAQSGEADALVYIYGASSGGLRCVSCNRTGARPSGRDVSDEFELAKPYWVAAQLPGKPSQIYPSRLLAEDGSRLFFQSFEPLAYGDTNGKQDVYEWEAAGSGSCSGNSSTFSADAGGCVNLVSSGESSEDSRLLDTDADGSDVFFTTTSSLVVQDLGLIDIYDAREGGGFPPPPLGPVQCEGETCQRPGIVPSDSTPGSSSFNGPGNPAVKKPKKCSKGKQAVRSKGKTRCVKKKQKKAGHGRNRRGER